MKKILLSILISFVFLTGYLLVAGVIVVVMSKGSPTLDRTAIGWVDAPLRLPKYIYYKIVPPTAEDYSTDTASLGARKTIVAIGFFVSNVLLYSVPIYFVVILIFRARKQVTVPNEEPPPPTQFG